jgi:hypothetical protein
MKAHAREEEMMTKKRLLLVGTMLLSLSLVVLGCKGESGGGTQAKGADTSKKTDTGGDKKAFVMEGKMKRVTEVEHEDGGYWCGIHGIPEEECGKCNPELREKAKAAGDWCETHKRMKSQCFACDPTLYEKVFEPKYTAKFPGWLPKRPPEKEFQ